MADIALRRVGWALILVGLIDIAVMVYCIVIGQAYSSSFNVFAVIAGIFLLRRNMRVAHWVSYFSAFALAASVTSLVLIPLYTPLDLWVTRARLEPLMMTLTTAAIPAFLALLAWVYRTLTSEAVMQARSEAGVNAKPPKSAFAIGAALGIGLAVTMAAIPRTDSAELVLRKAQEQTGPGYRYFISAMHWSNGSGNATVTAWNGGEVKDIYVEW